MPMPPPAVPGIQTQRLHPPGVDPQAPLHLPTAWIADLADVDQLLFKAATMMSLNMRSSLEEVDLNPALNRYLAVMSPLHFLSRAHSYNRAMGEIVQLRDEPSIAAYNLYEMFRSNYFKATEKGPSAVISYLKEKDAQYRYASEAVKWKFENARKANDEMVIALNRAHAEQRVIRVTCDAAILAIGTVFPITWWVGAGISVGYSVICKIAANTSDAHEAGLMGFATNNALGTAATLAQDRGDKFGLNIPGKKTIYEEAEKQAAKAAGRYQDKIQAFQKLRGANYTRGQERAILRAASKAEDAALAARNAGTAYRSADAARRAEEVFAQSSRLGKAAAVGTRGFGLAVGLYFLKDDIVGACEEIGTNIWTDNAR